ncbi:MAG: bis-aminopropyl spermidine synthase family protein [Nitrososphaerales archaeon]
MQILYELVKSNKSFWELLDITHYTLRDFLEAINSLYEEGLIAIKDGEVYLTDKGMKKVNKKGINFENKICEKCEGKRILFNGKFKEILERFKEIVRERPIPNLEFYQGYMREYDVIARVALMHSYNDLLDKEFLLLGDDDLLSIALSLTKLPSKVLVLDVDERIGEFIKKVNKDYGLEINFQKYDVSDPLPRNLIGKFDVFSSEPLETISGLKAFIIRGVSCLRDEGVGYFGLSTAEASYKKWIKIQKILTKMNCVLTDIIRGFSRYPTRYGNINYEKFTTKLKFQIDENPGIYWFKSALFRFEALGKPRLIIDPDKALNITYIDKVEDVTHPIFY